MRISWRASPSRGHWIAGLPLAVVLAMGGCGSDHRTTTASGIPPALLAEVRPIGRGVRFEPPATGPVLGSCRRGLGARFGFHLELFAENRVVLLPAGIGTRPPRTYSLGRISGARCYGDLVTLEPTGIVLVRPGLRLVLSDLFRSWGQPLSARRLASFVAPGASRVTVFIDGHRWSGPPGNVPLARHREIVLEVGPYVPPHSAYEFPPGT